MAVVADVDGIAVVVVCTSICRAFGFVCAGGGPCVADVDGVGEFVVSSRCCRRLGSMFAGGGAYAEVSDVILMSGL